MTISKRSIISTAIGAVCVVGLTAAAVIVLKGNASDAQQLAEDKEIHVDIPVGTYYYEGDTTSDFRIEVTEDKTIQLLNISFDEVAQHFKSDDPSLTDEDIAEIIENYGPEYKTPTEYTAIYFPDLDYTGILVSWSGESGYGYEYAAENTISWGSVDGDFILVE
ncbi:MAG: hypothetical protein IJZ47_01080 [Oscillospiraceae bacterium]|nr:hypothetical protein [Oscillospiraceae bacterium]